MTPAIFGLSAPTLTAEERAFFREADPAGYILFGRNVESRAQLRALTDDLRSLHGRDRLFICIDQEGGRVARMKPPHWGAYPAGEIFSRLYDRAPASAIVAARANAEAIGLEHIPGHGRAGADSHKEMPTVTAGEVDLETDLAPFRALAHADIGMTGHICFEAWDKENPATWSPFIIDEIIRRRIGFDGLLLTDDIDMAALWGTIPERSARAILAGCDLVLNCWADMDDMVGIARALPGISAATRARLDRALAKTAVPAEPGKRHAEAIARRDGMLALLDAPA